MLFAADIKTREKTQAFPGGRANCPGCGATVIAKCGEINVWHWAHEVVDDCDPWSEGESVWHAMWKSFAGKDRVEIKFGPHRADIVGTSGIVIELQHSSLSPEVVREREGFYKDMVWLCDAREFTENLCLRDRGDYYSFRWKWPRKWMFSITKPLFLDFGDGDLLLAKKIYNEVPCGGWGTLCSREQFVNRYLGVDETGDHTFEES